MSGPVKLLTTPEVADALGVPVGQLRRTIVRLKREHGFPECIPGMGHRYDPEAVGAWIARYRKDATPAPAANDDEDAELAAWQAKLDARSVQIGRSGGRA